MSLLINARKTGSRQTLWTVPSITGAKVMLPRNSPVPLDFTSTLNTSTVTGPQMLTAKLVPLMPPNLLKSLNQQQSQPQPPLQPQQQNLPQLSPYLTMRKRLFATLSTGPGIVLEMGSTSPRISTLNSAPLSTTLLPFSGGTRSSPCTTAGLTRTTSFTTELWP